MSILGGCRWALARSLQRHRMTRSASGYVAREAESVRLAYEYQYSVGRRDPGRRSLGRLGRSLNDVARDSVERFLACCINLPSTSFIILVGDGHRCFT